MTAAQPDRLDRIEALIESTSKTVAANSKTVAANSKAVAANSKAVAANSKAVAANSEAITALFNTVERQIEHTNNRVSTLEETLAAFAAKTGENIAALTVMMGRVTEETQQLKRAVDYLLSKDGGQA